MRHSLESFYFFKKVRPNPLAPDEALLFVDYDSAPRDSDGVVGIAHGAFEDHHAPPKVHRRRSIETRCLVLYD